MNSKKIKEIINSRFNYLLTSITDQEVQEAVKSRSIITGGCFVSMLLNEDINDFDIYFRDYNTTKLVLNYYIGNVNRNIKIEDLFIRVEDDLSLINERGDVIDFIRHRKRWYREYKNRYVPVEEEPRQVSPFRVLDNNSELKKRVGNELQCITSSCISLKDVQLITKFYGNPNDIHSTYDFIHCTNYWTSWNDRLALNRDALESIINKELKFKNTRYALSSLFRVKKFLSRGWSISAGELAKIGYAISLLDLSNIENLKDQLVGVDIVMFLDVIKYLKDNELEICFESISKAIDEVF